MNGYNQVKHVKQVVVTTITAGVLLGLASHAYAAPRYELRDVLVAEDQWQGENSVISPRPIFKPHETDATDAGPLPGGDFFWISSNERGEEEDGEPVPSKAGISILDADNNTLSTLEIEDVCIPVVGLDGEYIKQFGGCAPAGAEKHPRHPHGIDIDAENLRAYQVIEHSGLRWNEDRSGFKKANNTDEESGLLVVYDVSDPRDPILLHGYVLGHGAEESAVNENNGKVYVGNHEPSPTDVPCFVSVIDETVKSAPYRFIDLPSESDCVQGIEVDESLNQVFGTTHIGEKMFAFNSGTDTIVYAVDIRAPFEEFFGRLPAEYLVHMHDLTTDNINHRAYQTIHTLAADIETEGEEEESEDEISGRWVAEVNTDPDDRRFKQVNIIDLSNGQSASEVPTHHDAVETGLSFDRLFVHAHFLFADPGRKALLVSGEHTGNLAVVDTTSHVVKQVLAISRPIPGCVPPPPEPGEEPKAAPEPHVHGVNIQSSSGFAYVSDEGEDCFYESVTVLQPKS